VDVADKDWLVLYTRLTERGSLFVVPAQKEADGGEGDSDGDSSWFSTKMKKDKSINIHTYTHI